MRSTPEAISWTRTRLSPRSMASMRPSREKQASRSWRLGDTLISRRIWPEGTSHRTRPVSAPGASSSEPSGEKAGCFEGILARGQLDQADPVAVADSDLLAVDGKRHAAQVVRVIQVPRQQPPAGRLVDRFDLLARGGLPDADRAVEHRPAYQL